MMYFTQVRSAIVSCSNVSPIPPACNIVKVTQSLVRVFQSRKIAAILLLGIASGLPYALMDDAFRGWMTKAQLNLRTIGWFSLIIFPYSASEPLGYRTKSLILPNVLSTRASARAVGSNLVLVLKA